MTCRNNMEGGGGWWSVHLKVVIKILFKQNHTKVSVLYWNISTTVIVANPSCADIQSSSMTLNVISL